MDRGAWQASVRGVTKSQTRLSMHAHYKIKNIFFILCGVFFVVVVVSCTICVKQIYYIRVLLVNYVSWLTLLDLHTNWTYKYALRIELVHI